MGQVRQAAGGATALVCDLDGVVRHYDSVAQAAVEARYGLPRGAISRACFSSPLLNDAISGRVRDERWRQAAARQLTGLTAATAAEAVREWSDLPVAVAADVLDLLAQVRVRHPVVLLTNATDRLPADLDRLGLVDSFDAIVNTSDVGAPKPEAAAFVAAAAAASTVLGRAAPPDTIAYVDDTVRHVTAAEALGWRGHVYVDAAALRDFLQRCGLLR